MADEILKPAPEDESGILELLRKASEQQITVIFGPDGMTVDEIVNALRCTDPKHLHRLMIIGDAPHSVPGGHLVN